MALNFDELKLPSNTTFGYFFSALFFGVAIYFFLMGDFFFTASFGVFSSLFLTISVFNPVILAPFNRLWMLLGLKLGLIVNPIMMGFIFFILITPVSLVTRAFGRDELRLRFIKKNSYWIQRDGNSELKSCFNKQF